MLRAAQAPIKAGLTPGSLKQTMAFCHRRRANRTFRLDRMRLPEEKE